MKWELDTAKAFSAWLGHPEREPAFVHVSGTNGKGSVAATIHAIAQAAGLRAGLFTSPHLVCPTERIRIGEKSIDQERFLTRIESLRSEADRALRAGAIPRYPSFFEMMTAAAFCEFAESQVQVAALETGLGGRLDATNVVFPRVSVITNIGPDHMKSLGGSLDSIAREKAGTIKPGVPVVCGWIPCAQRDIVREVAIRCGAPLHEVPLETRAVEVRPGVVDIETPETRYTGLRPALGGSHQLQNLAVALRAVEVLRVRAGLPIDGEAIARGVSAVNWPGRLERIDGRPRVLLDAAHNKDGAEALARFLAERDAREGRPSRRVLIFGLTEGRDPEAMFGPLAEHVDEVVLCPPETTRAIDRERMDAGVRAHERPCRSVTSAANAISAAREAAGEEGEILVAGVRILLAWERHFASRRKKSRESPVLPDRAPGVSSCPSRFLPPLPRERSA